MYQVIWYKNEYRPNVLIHNSSKKLVSGSLAVNFSSDQMAHRFGIEYARMNNGYIVDWEVVKI